MSTVTRRIAYQGEPGSNSHQVCKQHYPDWETLPCASFEDVFAAVEGGPGVEPSADLAMIPIDNSIAGRVADIHHFLPASGLHIIAEHFLRIRFHLLGVPGSSLETITTVHSHVHALGQCRKVIREHGLKPVIAGDTAGGAPAGAARGGPPPGGRAPGARPPRRPPRAGARGGPSWCLPPGGRARRDPRSLRTHRNVPRSRRLLDPFGDAETSSLGLGCLKLRSRRG